MRMKMGVIPRYILFLGSSGIAVLLLYYYIGHQNDVRPAASEYSGIDLLWAEKQGTGQKIVDTNRVQVMFIFTKAYNNKQLQSKFRHCVHSLLKHSSKFINVHVVSDEKSKLIATNIFSGLPRRLRAKKKVHFHNMDALALAVTKSLGKVLQYFRFSPGAYFGDSLFFVSMITYKLFPEWPRLIMLDADLEFRNDIYKLWMQFRKFNSSQVIGIGHEMQPVYYNVFSKFRSENPGRNLGGPLPTGFPGYNSGVVLLDLDKIRKQSSYSRYLTEFNVQELATKYKFQGHLGDQDFYTLLGVEQPQFFYPLSCGWNRQLCTWWRDKGFQNTFQRYFSCNDPVNIYHGNCNTSFPSH